MSRKTSSFFLKLASGSSLRSRSEAFSLSRERWRHIRGCDSGRLPILSTRYRALVCERRFQKLISMQRILSLSLRAGIFKRMAQSGNMNDAAGDVSPWDSLARGGGTRRARKRASAHLREREEKYADRKRARVLLISAVVNAVPRSSVEFRFARCHHRASANSARDRDPGSNRRPSRKSIRAVERCFLLLNPDREMFLSKIFSLFRWMS